MTPQPALLRRPLCLALACALAAAATTPCAARRKGAGGARGSQVETFEHAWSRVRDTYPYPDMKGLDWQAVHDELLPRAAEARTPAQLRPVLHDMLARLGESHFQVIPKEAYASLDELAKAGRPSKGGAKDETAQPDPAEAEESDERGDIGVDVGLVDGQAVVTRVDAGSPADLAGVRPGFVVVSVGGVEVAEAIDETRKAMAASGHADEKLAAFAAHAAVAGALAGPPGSVVTVGFLHGGDRTATVEIERRKAPGERNRIGQLPEMVVDFHSEVLPGDVGYVRFNIFLGPVAARFDEAMAAFIERRVRGVIVDLRGNPGGLGGMVIGMAGHFIDESGRSLGRMKLRGAQLEFNANPRLHVYQGPVAVLVDDMSMSTSELFAAGLKGLGRARVFGTTSPGMALPSVIESLPNGDRLQFVTADLLDPKGERIEGRGVEPHETVKLTRKSLLAGKDDVVAAAVAWIERECGGAPAAVAAARD